MAGSIQPGLRSKAIAPSCGVHSGGWRITMPSCDRRPARDGAWLDAEFGMTPRTATNMMAVAAKYGAKLETVSNLSPKALYELSASTAEVQAEVERRIGQLLIDMKAKLGHGNFLPWLEAEFGMSEVTARKMMRVAEAFKSKPSFDLPVSALYELAAPSTPPEVQAEVERRIAAGEIVSAAEVKQLKRDMVTVSHENDALKGANRDLLPLMVVAGSRYVSWVWEGVVLRLGVGVRTSVNSRCSA